MIYLSLGVIFIPGVFAQNVDPTRPLSLNGSATTMIANEDFRLVLETIIYGDQIYTAVINGKVMKIGDHIGAHQLVTVNKHSVVLRSEDERLELTLFSDVLVK